MSTVRRLFHHGSRLFARTDENSPISRNAYQSRQSGGVQANCQQFALASFFFVVYPGHANARDVAVGAKKVYLEADTLKLNVNLDSLFSRRALDAIASGLITSVVMEFRLDSDRQSKALEYTIGNAA